MDRCGSAFGINAISPPQRAADGSLVGASRPPGPRSDIERRPKLEFSGGTITSDAGFPANRGARDTLGAPPKTQGYMNRHARLTDRNKSIIA